MKKKYLLLIVLATVLVALLTTACPNNFTNISSPTPFFPVQKSGFDQMDALLEGELRLDDGYSRVEVEYSDDEDLVIWPHGFSVRTKGKEIQVIDSDGQIAARVGEWIRLGGGEVPDETAEEIIGQPLPADCAGPYWIVSEVITY